MLVPETDNAGTHRSLVGAVAAVLGRLSARSHRTVGVSKSLCDLDVEQFDPHDVGTRPRFLQRRGQLRSKESNSNSSVFLSRSRSILVIIHKYPKRERTMLAHMIYLALILTSLAALILILWALIDDN